MDLRRLAGGSDVNAPTVFTQHGTPSRLQRHQREELIDQQVGAQLHTMSSSTINPPRSPIPHDHPFEEAYVFIEATSTR